MRAKSRSPIDVNLKVAELDFRCHPKVERKTLEGFYWSFPDHNSTKSPYKVSQVVVNLSEKK